MKFTRELLSRKNQKGIAILLAVFCVMMIVYIVTEVTYESNVEYAIHAQSVNRLKAYYAARSGLELSLLRIKIYKKIQQQYGKQLGSQAGMLNLIWSFPLNWPPVLPDEASAVDKDIVKGKLKESKMDANFVATIFDEGSKIDLNDLDSPAKALREATKKMLLQIFENKRLNEPDWAREHQNFREEELVNNIIDWVDANKEALNGGDEAQNYGGELFRGSQAVSYPPNRAFRTLDELRLVVGMTDELFNLLASRVTVYGAKAINPNTASREVFKSLDASITDDVVAKITERRDDPKKGGPFTAANDFWDFVNASGGRVPQDTQKEVPLIFESVTNFRIQSVGEFGNSIRQIDAVVFDLAAAAAVVAEKLKNENSSNPSASPTPTPSPAPGTSNANAPNQSASKGAPRIVYWFEK